MTGAINRVSEARGIARGERELATLRPFFRRKIVERIVKRMFPQHQQGEIWKILNRYPSESEEIASRIHLDALKLSGGSADRLIELIDTAKQDRRDVIIPAENSRLHALGVVAYAGLSDDEKDRISNEDLNEYLDWIG